MRRFGTHVCLAIGLALCYGFGCGCAAATRPAPTPPKNVILMIGDGMGFQQVKAAGLYANGRSGSLFLQTLPYKGNVQTISVFPAHLKRGRVHVTDSAAAATAMATGHKVFNGVISLALPGDGHPYKTVLESFAADGKRTGLVTTAYITDATPAGFGAHSKARGNAAEILDCYLKTVRPDVILGGGYTKWPLMLTPGMVEAAGYKAVTDREQLLALKPGQFGHVFGIFGLSNMPYEADKAAAATQPAEANMLAMPSLSQMTAVALRMLSTDHKGFFLMVEGGLIDKAAHKNDLARSVPETVEFDKAVKVAMDWARNRKDTLVLVTADHETGGLKVIEGRGKGNLPEVTWSSNGHTNARVPLYAWGVGADKIQGTLDNTDIYRLMMGTFDKSSARAQAIAVKHAAVMTPQSAAVPANAD